MSPETKSIPFSGIDKQRLGAPRNSRPSKSSAVAQQAGRGALAPSLSFCLSLYLYLLRVGGSPVWRDRMSFAGVACGAADDSLE